MVSAGAPPPVRRTEDLALEEHVLALARELRRRAALGTFDGRETPSAARYLGACRCLDARTGAVLIFTRDEGMHSSGWFKNPDYERCEHLSLSPRPSGLVVPDGRGGWTESQGRELDRAMTARIVRAFFGEHLDKVWAESPKSPEGRARNVWHWRLFCDAHWQPILPRDEVYSREFTEVGWQSASAILTPDGRGLHAG